MHGECGGIAGERMGLGAKCEGNPGEHMGTGAEPGECKEMQGNAKGTYQSRCKVPWECRGMLGERMGWVQSTRGMQGNAREC